MVQKLLEATLQVLNILCVNCLESPGDKSDSIFILSHTEKI